MRTPYRYPQSGPFRPWSGGPLEQFRARELVVRTVDPTLRLKQE
jgi:hypothetical protein